MQNLGELVRTILHEAGRPASHQNDLRGILTDSGKHTVRLEQGDFIGSLLTHAVDFLDKHVKVHVIDNTDTMKTLNDLRHVFIIGLGNIIGKRRDFLTDSVRNTGKVGKGVACQHTTGPLRELIGSIYTVKTLEDSLLSSAEHGKIIHIITHEHGIMTFQEGLGSQTNLLGHTLREIVTLALGLNKAVSIIQ